jgi:hypothetical protein
MTWKGFASIETSIAVLEDPSRRTGQFEMVAAEDVSLLNRSFFNSGKLPVSESQKSDSPGMCAEWQGLHGFT